VFKRLGKLTVARIFHAVVEGDPITGGGYLVVPAHGDRVSDDEGRKRYLAYIGHGAWCAQCKTMGTIVGGSGISEDMRICNSAIGGKRQAVSGDLIACDCETQPTIIARYATWWTFSDDAATDPSVERTATGGQLRNRAHDHDEQIRAIGTGSSPGYPYFIETADGRTESGRLDSQAFLSRISTIAAEDYTIYWGDEALDKRLGE
jgi:hypothetical protein